MALVEGAYVGPLVADSIDHRLSVDLPFRSAASGVVMRLSAECEPVKSDKTGVAAWRLR